MVSGCVAESYYSDLVQVLQEVRTSMSVSVIIKWGGQEYSISTLSEEDTVLDLKQSIKSLTGVLPERQKLLGLKVKGKTHLWMADVKANNCFTAFES